MAEDVWIPVGMAKPPTAKVAKPPAADEWIPVNQGAGPPQEGVNPNIRIPPGQMTYDEAGFPIARPGQVLPPDVGMQGAPPPEKPDAPYTGTILPLRRDESGVHLAVPEAIAGPARGLVEGGERAAGTGEAGRDPTRPLGSDTMATLWATIGSRLGGMGDRGMLGAARPPREPGVMPQSAENAITKSFARSVKPTVAGKASAGDVARQTADVQSAVRSILANKDMVLGEPGAEVPGGLPKNMRQFTEAIAQTKEKIFGLFNSMAREAQTAETPGGVTTIPKFTEAFAKTSRAQAEAERAVSAANRAVTAAKAKQSKAGNVYSSSFANRRLREAEGNLSKAEIALARISRQKESARADLRGVWVDLDPIVKELRAFTRDPTMTDIPDHAPALRKAESWIAKLRRRGAYSPMEAQNQIKSLNSMLKSFYSTSGNPASSMVNAMVANRLRSGLDEAIEGAVGEGYQGLKREYGALSAIEKQVTHRAEMEARRPTGSFMGNLSDLFTAEELIRGIVTLNPAAVATGIGMGAATRMLGALRTPDRIAGRMFTKAERAMKPEASVRGAAGGGVAGGAAAEPGQGGNNLWETLLSGSIKPRMPRKPDTSHLVVEPPPPP